MKSGLAAPSPFNFLIRPRRFGKTLNLSMLKYFFDKVYDGLKTQIDKTTAQNNVADSSMSEIKLSLDQIKSNQTEFIPQNSIPNKYGS